MFYERAADGKQYPQKTEQPAATTNIFKNRQAGFFERLMVQRTGKHDELEGVGWEWQSVDGCMVKAPLALEAVGKNPADQGKEGTGAQPRLLGPPLGC